MCAAPKTSPSTAIKRSSAAANTAVQSTCLRANCVVITVSGAMPPSLAASCRLQVVALSDTSICLTDSHVLRPAQPRSMAVFTGSGGCVVSAAILSHFPSMPESSGNQLIKGLR